jgi:hypothetical protein
MDTDTIPQDEAQGNCLLPHHRQQLAEGSGIAPEVIIERGYRSIVPPEGYSALKPHGFTRPQANLPGLLMPLWTTDGQNGLAQYRPDQPRLGKDGKPIKYETPKNAGVRVDCPPRCQPMLADPSMALWVTEGLKKGDALASYGLCAIALLGVWNFKGKNPFGGTTVLADFDHIALKGRNVRIVFDNDVMTKPQVQKALQRLTEHLQRKGAHVTAVYLPQAGGRKIGVDNFLLVHTVQELEGLIEQPRPEPQPAAPMIELLSHAPALISRPLSLIDGRAYAATWLWVKKTDTEARAKNGDVVPLPVPQVTQEERLFLQRDDGEWFGEVTDRKVHPLCDLGLTVHLPEIPVTSRLWSASGFVAYHAGARAEAVSVFRRVVDVVDAFIDFNRSLADQTTMSEMIGCYILSTWFLEAFNVVGFLWPNGDRGSGKTQLLNVVAELSYLGQTILAGGSYACLRDLADYGATLAFDDAEHLSDPRHTDPDKRALLLAGNRRGNTVPVKEPTPSGTWRTRHVNTFCPRLFSAIRLPDAVLASRSIVVPLIRTPDRQRANADPLDYAKWPHDRSKLIDDLWSLALRHLPDLPHYVAQVDTLATLTGRNLEPWRPLLTVGRWLEDAGVEGLWTRMEALSQAYQQERPDLESADLMVLTIKVLCHYATNATSATNMEGGAEWICTSAEIKAGVVTIATDEESGLDTEKLSTDRVGRVLGRMRFKKKPREGGKGSRQWVIPLADLQGWVTSYGLCISDKWPPSHTSGTSGTTQPTCPTCGQSDWMAVPGGDAVCKVCPRQA